MNLIRNFRRCFALAAFTAASTIGVARPVYDFQTPKAICNVTLVSPDGRSVASATILFDRGRIIATDPDLTIPAHAEVIDGEGLYAYPAFIDASCFLGLPDEKEDKRSDAERERLEDGKLDPREGPFAMTRDANRLGIMPNWRAYNKYAPAADQLAAHWGSGFATALVVPRNRIIGGTSVAVLLFEAAIRRATLAKDVAMHASFQRGEEGGYPGSLLGVFAHFRQVMLDAGCDCFDLNSNGAIDLLDTAQFQLGFSGQ